MRGAHVGGVGRPPVPPECLEAAHERLTCGVERGRGVLTRRPWRVRRVACEAGHADELVVSVVIRF